MFCEAAWKTAEMLKDGKKGGSKVGDGGMTAMLLNDGGGKKKKRKEGRCGAKYRKRGMKDRQTERESRGMKSVCGARQLAG